MSGGAGDDLLSGGAGDDVLGGGGLGSGDSLDTLLAAVIIDGGGNDRLFGGSGSDTFLGDPGADIIQGDDGTDVVNYFFSTVGVTIELGGSVGQGGFAQGDQLFGIEVLVGSNHDDNIGGGPGDTSVIGGDGNDIVFGREGRNFLSGGDGNDFLQGLGGVDTMRGGDGADHFQYFNRTESGVGAGNRDVVQDFSQAEGDKIDLFFVDADVSIAGVQTFTFQGPQLETLGFFGNAVTFFGTADHRTIVQVFVGGDGQTTADFQIELAGDIALNAGNFVL